MVHDMKTLLEELDMAGISHFLGQLLNEAGKAVGGLCGNLTSSEAHKCWSPLCPHRAGALSESYSVRFSLPWLSCS